MAGMASVVGCHVSYTSLTIAVVQLECHVIAKLNLLAMIIIQSYCVVTLLPAKILSSQARGLYRGTGLLGPL